MGTSFVGCGAATRTDTPEFWGEGRAESVGGVEPAAPAEPCLGDTHTTELLFSRSPRAYSPPKAHITFPDPSMPPPITVTAAPLATGPLLGTANAGFSSGKRENQRESECERERVCVCVCQVRLAHLWLRRQLELPKRAGHGAAVPRALCAVRHFFPNLSFTPDTKIDTG